MAKETLFTRAILRSRRSVWLSVGAVTCALMMALPTSVGAASTTWTPRAGKIAKVAQVTKTAKAAKPGKAAKRAKPARMARGPVLRHGTRAVADQKRARLVVHHRTVLRETPRVLRIKRADPEATVVAGQNGVFTLSVTNNGPAVATNVVVTDTLDPRLEIVSLPEGCTASGQVITCRVDSLAVGATQTWDITVRVRPDTPPGTTIPNVSSVDSDTSTSTDSNEVIINVTGESDLSITKTADTLNSGGTGTYTITVTNNGPSDNTGVVVTDTLPPGLTFVSSAPPGCTAAGQVVTCPIGNLAAGTSTTITLTVDVDESVAGTVTNTASVTGDNPDPNPDDNTVTIETPVNAVSDLTITKSVRAE
ncbi:hypothetical protein ACFQ08_09745 [Streptosporangium algeriense]|uniref:Ig-like domain-containing protein n=1 Tax=Streptosporangium algeriense TaxID=1682748 RepID=A0ABW3DLV7_9ACTN